MAMLSRNRPGRKQAPSRRGSATVELAVVLPVLLLVALITVDMGRFGKYQITAANAARNGAYYGAKSMPNSTDTAGIKSAALADITGNLEVNPNNVTVTSALATDTQGNQQIQVTVTIEFDLFYEFGNHTINYGGKFNVVSTCSMVVIQY
jgi:Flp pilus assembly protein TadG